MLNKTNQQTFMKITDFRNIMACILVCKKVKFALEQAMKTQRGSRGIAVLFLTLVLDRSGWLTPCSSCFTVGKETWYPLYRRLGGPQGRSGWVQKISPPLVFDPQTILPVASHYID
jgi:hypothetical protein